MATESATRKTSTRKRSTPSTAKDGQGNGQPSPAPSFPVTELNAAVEQLQRPFTRGAVRIKPQATADRNGGKVGLVTFYIDSRLVVERLNAVVGPDAWAESYKPVLDDAMGAAAHFFPVECTLTVLGVSRTDVGQYQSNTTDDKAWKSGYSDALKRAAVKFRIGAYLYGTPNVWVECKVGNNGKVQGFTDAGRDKAFDVYDKWLRQVMQPRFGEPLDHGDLEHVETIDAPNGGNGNGATQPQPSLTPAPTPAPTSSPPPAQSDHVSAQEDAELVARLLNATEKIGAKDVALTALAKHRSENENRLKREWITSQVDRAEEAAALKGDVESKPEPCGECGAAAGADHREGCSNDIPF